MELSAHEFCVDHGLDSNGDFDDMEEEDNDDENYEEDQLYCYTCERYFSNNYSFKKHMSEHRTCGIDGCSFTAHEKIIEKHIIMQHTTGLYDKIRNITTPEDVAKWIADRKNNYPTKENIEKRYKKQEEMFKRGEKIQRNKDRFGRSSRTRLQKPNAGRYSKESLPTKNRKRKTNFQKKEKMQSLIDERCNWNGNLFPFRGTRELYSPEKREDNEFDDNEWIEENKPKNTTSKLQLNNALGALMTAYNSSDESDVEIKADPLLKTSLNICDNTMGDIIKANSEDEGPVEEKILRLPEQLTIEQENKGPQNKSDYSGTRNKRKRRRLAGKGKQQKQGDNQQLKVQVIENKNGECTITRKFKKRRATLLEKLLESEIRHERNVLLQCVRYVVSNNFFDAIETET